MPSRKDSRSKQSSSRHTANPRRRSSGYRTTDSDVEARLYNPGEDRRIYRSIRRSTSPNASASFSPRPTYSRHRSSSASGLSRQRSRRKVYNVVDFGMERRASASHLSSSRTNTTPYPSFSKAHSRESVARDESTNNSPRDRQSSNTSHDSWGSRRRSDNKYTSYRSLSNATKPYTNEPSTRVRRVQSGSSMRSTDKSPERQLNRSPTKDGKPSAFDSQLRFSASRTSLRDAEEGKSNLSARGNANVTVPSPLRKSAPLLDQTDPKTSNNTRQPSSHRRNTSYSDATSVAPDSKRNGPPPTLLYHRGVSPSSDPESFPRTPNGQDTLSAVTSDDRKYTPEVEVMESANSDQEYVDSNPNSMYNAPEHTLQQQQPHPPPPPPPPPLDGSSSDIPKINYLLQNGGLQNSISKRFITAASNKSTSQSSLQSPLQNRAAQVTDAKTAFTPYVSFLDDLEKVMLQNGSVAVATGYKSIAKKLVDRLESVFGRNISSQLCPCVMCTNDRQASNAGPIDTRVSWGEVLEFVTGRRVLPPWPPFSLPTSSTGLGLSGLGHRPPMQKLDVDVPDEYRDHYIRQSKKTKQAVDKWLAGQPDDHRSPPSEVDDETLTFAMLTYLEPAQRRQFTALIRGLPSIPDARTPTPAPTEPKPDLMTKVGLALLRLYQLSKQPREPECAMYLLKNPDMHSVLATLAAISNQEWDTLVSGRFDGFLISGAEKQFPSMGPIPSRGPTPFARGASTFTGSGSSSFSSPSTPGTTTKQNSSRANGVTNGAASAPTQIDEETEIAVLAEVEREIYTGMEALEDAFELLHLRAENVRKALRERSAGLALSARMNDIRGGKSVDADLDARLGTPFDGTRASNSFAGPSRTPQLASPLAKDGRRGSISTVNYGPDSDDGLDDIASLAPDDSASNVGWREKSKHRHHRRRKPRKTPAPVEEDDE